MMLFQDPLRSRKVADGVAHSRPVRALEGKGVARKARTSREKDLAYDPEGRNRPHRQARF